MLIQTLPTQKIQYAKGKSHFVSKLDGSFKIPNMGTGAANVEQTDLQRSIFDAPLPGSAAPPATGGGLPAKPPGSTDQKMTDSGADAARGQKRTRDEEEEEDSDEDVAMEEDSDDE